MLWFPAFKTNSYIYLNTSSLQKCPACPAVQYLIQAYWSRYFPLTFLFLSFVTKSDVRHKSGNFNSLQLYQILATVLGISTAQTSSNYKELKDLSFLLNFSCVPFDSIQVVFAKTEKVLDRCLRKTRNSTLWIKLERLIFVSRDAVGWNYDKQVYLRLGHENSTYKCTSDNEIYGELEWGRKRSI